MAVVDIPIGNLDNESDLMDWLANELVTNHHFVERRRVGNIADNDIVLVLQRDQADTFHNDGDFLLLLEKAGNTDTAVDNSFTINVSHNDYETTLESTTPDAGLIVDWDVAQNEIVLQVGSTNTSWTALGYTAGQFCRISNAASGSNDGLYEILNVSTTTLTADTLEFQDVGNGGIKDVQVADVTDTITAVEEINIANVFAQGFNLDQRNALSGLTWNAGVDGMGSGPYLRARLITNPTSTSATPSEELYFIVIIETSTDTYRQFSFGEVVKLVEFIGGHFFSGAMHNLAADIDNQHVAWLQGSLTDTYNENSNSNAAPFAVWGSVDFSGAVDNEEYGFGWFNAGAQGTVSFDAPTQFTMAVMPHYRGIAREMIGYSPSAFSGQSERWPITCFGCFNTRQYTAAQAQIAPMCVIPDVFLADITNVDAYSVFQDTFGEKFMVVPMLTKSGSGVGSSEKWGYLVRNPDLVVT